MGINYALLFRLHQEVFQIQQSLLAGIHVDEGGGNTSLAGTTGTTDLMDVILNLFRHRVHDDMLDFVEIESFARDARGDHDVFGARLECSNGILSFLLGYSGISRVQIGCRTVPWTHSCYRGWQLLRRP